MLATADNTIEVRLRSLSGVALTPTRHAFGAGTSIPQLELGVQQVRAGNRCSIR
jgi:hypothetical protein